MQLGVCYYPEHWPEARWQQDASQMRALGLDVVRIGEFAWGKIEPEEGRYDWGWLDRAVEVLAGVGLKVVLGTPSAAPPAWLSHRYPDTLPVDAQGRRRRFGGRRHYCPNSPVYQTHSARIATALGERYGRHPRVIGWQIDNEFGGGKTSHCYCEHCTLGFRRWLADRYGSLEALNQAWGTVFWSQTYSAWEQIQPPNLVTGRANPSHLLDYDRFATASYRRYMDLQIAALRPALPGSAFITHNFMGLYPDLDAFELAAPLDFVTWDSYPTGNADRWGSELFGANNPATAPLADAGDPAVTGMAHDLMRGLLRQPFWIMEAQAGHINWGRHNPPIRSEVIRLWTWHALAAGANAVLYFRWRAALDAQEQFHSGLLDHAGMPDAGYQAVESLHVDRETMAGLVHHPVTPQVALLFDFADLWALRHQPHTQEYTYLRHLFVYYQALQRLGITVDVVSPETDLNGYQLVVAPTVWISSEAMVPRLSAYVQGGGILLLGVRSGFKTTSNRVTQGRLPGPFLEMAGIVVEAWHSLPPGGSYPLESPMAGLGGEAALWVEALRPTTSEPRASYSGGPFQNRAALTLNDWGSGQVWYQGWFPTVAQARAVLEHLAAMLNLDMVPGLTPGVVAARRGPFRILLNFTETDQEIVIGGQTARVGPLDLAVLGDAGGLQG